MSISTKLEELNLRRKDLCARIIDNRELSKIENHHALPTVPQLQHICQRLECMPLDLFAKEEIDLIGCMTPKQASNERKGDRHKLTHKKTFRVTDGVATALTDELLHACGYSSLQSWFDACVRRLFAEYAAKRKGESKAG